MMVIMRRGMNNVDGDNRAEEDDDAGSNAKNDDDSTYATQCQCTESVSSPSP